MTVDPLVLMAEVRRATDRLLATAASLDDTLIAIPSALPGWSRGHVLSHLARNADACQRLLTWARTGVVTPAYPEPGQRETDIDAGAPRPLAEQVADLHSASTRFATTADDLPAEAWTVVLELPDAPQPAARVVWRRLREVEVHHVDLAAGYTPADWPEAFSHRLLHEVVHDLRGRPGSLPLRLHPAEAGHELTVGEPDGAPTISGSAHELAAWLIGRSPGKGLTVTPDGALPTPPPWI